MSKIVREALVVGIEYYEYKGALTGVAEKATEIAKLLEKQGGFKVTLLPKDGNKIAPGKAVSTKELKEAIIRKFKPKTQTPPDTVLFYFLGHGERDVNTGIEPESYLATTEINPDLGICGVSITWLRKILQTSPVRRQIVWLECCYSGELLNDLSTDTAKHDRCFITSSRDFEESSSDCPLTQALLKALDYTRQPRERLWVTGKMLVEQLQTESELNNDEPFLYLREGEEIFLTAHTDVLRKVREMPPEKGEVAQTDVRLSEKKPSKSVSLDSESRFIEKSPESHPKLLNQENVNQPIKTNVKVRPKKNERNDLILPILRFIQERKEVRCSEIRSQFGISAEVLNKLGERELLRLPSIPTNPTCKVSLTQHGINYIIDHS